MQVVGATWRWWLLSGGLFLMVWGGKLLVIERWGSDLPESDDWNAIAADAIVPWAQDRFGWENLFAAHNEHRVALTRGLNLLLVLANGQWDARLECTVSGALHALIVVGVFLLGARTLSRWAQVGWFLALALLTGPPVVWENIVRGFDSQHYLLIGLSVGVIAAWLGGGAAGSARWWAGFAAAVLALFTLGSGLLAPAVVVAVLLGTRSWGDVWREHRWTVAASVVIVCAGLLLAVRVPGHETHRAHSLAEFWTAFYHHLQWPLVRHAFFGVISYLPWLVLAWHCVVRRSRRDPADSIALAVGLWALLHYIAMALMRGALQPWPPVRGLENIVVGLAANLFILLRCLRSWRTRRAVAAFFLVGAAGWIGTCGYGLAAIIRENVTIVLPERHARVTRSEESVRAYLETGDIAVLRPNEIPYHSPQQLALFLDQPEIRAVLPASVQPAGAGVETAAGSVVVRALGRNGWWIVGLGAFVAVVGWVLVLPAASSGVSLNSTSSVRDPGPPRTLDA